MALLRKRDRVEFSESDSDLEVLDIDVEKKDVGLGMKASEFDSSGEGDQESVKSNKAKPDIEELKLDDKKRIKSYKPFTGEIVQINSTTFS